MALTKLDKNLNIVSALDNEPNDVGGLTSEDLKAKFDEGSKAIQEYINETLIPETEAAVEEVRGEIAGAVNEATENLESQLRGVVLGQIPNGTITEEKLDPEFVNSQYSKDEIISAETKDKFGLPETATPDNAFDALTAAMVTGEKVVQVEKMFEPWNDATLAYTANSPLQSLICINGEFYAASGTSSQLMHSKDGAIWNKLSYIHSDGISALRYINGNLIAVHGRKENSSGAVSRYISVSTDLGVTWNHYDLTTSANWMDIAYGNGVYVALAKNSQNGMISYCSTSTDLKNWTLQSFPDSDYWHRILFGNGKFVVYGNSGKVMHSENGANWTVLQPTETGHSGYSWGGDFGNGIFVMGGGGNGDSAMISSSTDGINWSHTNISGEQYICNFTFVDGYFYALPGAFSVASVGKVYRSADGVTWDLISTANLPSAKWSGIAYSPEKETFACVYDGAGGVWYTRNRYETETTLGDIAGTKVGGLSIIETGSYTGNGMYGTAYPNSITFGIRPALVIIMAERRAVFSGDVSGAHDYAIFVRGVSRQTVGREYSNSNTMQLNISWEDNTLSWWLATEYNSNSKYYAGQLNTSGTIYRYIAFGG